LWDAEVPPSTHCKNGSMHCKNKLMQKRFMPRKMKCNGGITKKKYPAKKRSSNKKRKRT